MKKLQANQMENLEGGLSKGCQYALIGLGLSTIAGIGLAVGTAGVGSVTLWGIGALWTGISSQGACHGEL